MYVSVSSLSKLRALSFLLLPYFLLNPLNAAELDFEYIYFSGDGATVTDSGTTAFTEITDDDTDTYWYAGFDYSSLTGMDTSYVSYDSDSGEYEIVFLFEASSDDGNIFANVLRQTNSVIQLAELVDTNDDESLDELDISFLSFTESSLTVKNSTYIHTVADSIVCRIYAKGTSATDVSEFSIDFYYPTDVSASAYSYTITGTSSYQYFTDDEDDFDDYIREIALQAEEVAESDTDDNTSDLMELFLNYLDSDATEDLIALILSDKDTYLTDVQTVLDSMNGFEVTIDGTDYAAFDLTLTELSDYDDLTGGSDLPVMSFDFDGLDVTSFSSDALDIYQYVGLVSSTNTLLTALFDAASTYGDTDSTTTFTPGDLSNKELYWLIILMDYSIDEDDDGADSQGVYSISVVNDTYDAIISGTVTDPSIAAGLFSTLTDSDSTVIVDEDSGWYDTWMGFVNIPESDPEWPYSAMFGFFYFGAGDVTNPWFYPVHPTLNTWIATNEALASNEGFWAYAIDIDDASVLNGWLFFAVDASEADLESWYVYEFNTDTFHAFSDL
ncbi:hypothetical protein [Rubellicoccus peritrichatus]|uniref:Uncharacterized protein n=1 Tax=Rubellicoccus peritrichatus TaxID=3080537 RepID=A0AAQ3L9P5_9BACT|nr:hypothetical protein [Puniceicoccus sp. CR14]WOO41247.1 hypothetical protein RZN69_21715 [Puniceicoccus sp. CR14]